MHLRRSITCYFASLLVLFVLSTIHLLNWFYSFSLNRLSLIFFCNWKKKKKPCLKNMSKPDPTCNPIDSFKNNPFWPVAHWPANLIDLTWPFCHVYLKGIYKNRFSPTPFPKRHNEVLTLQEIGKKKS